MSRGDLVSIDLIKDQLNQRIDTLVPQLFPAARKDGREWRLGDLCGSPGQSLAIRAAGPKAGWWKDFSSGEGGDVLTLIQHVCCKGDMRAAIQWARDWLGLGAALDPGQRRRMEEEAQRRRIAAERDEREARVRARRAAMRYFLDAVPLPGTPAERYLLGRGIDLKRLGRAPGALRFHPAMRDAAHGIDRPCMIAKLDGPDGQLVTIHRTFLHCHADGRVEKASRDPERPMIDARGRCQAKLAYSGYHGGWIPVWRGASGVPIRKMDDGEWITVTEGIEDALTVAMACPQMRVVAALSLSNLGNLQLPERAGGLFLAADNDQHPDAIEGFRRARAQLEARGFAVREVRPPPAFKDFNDWAKALFARPPLEGVA